MVGTQRHSPEANMAYVQPLQPPPRSGLRSRASSAASGKYAPPEYQPLHQQVASASMGPEPGTMSPPQTYNPPRPEIYQSHASYQAPTIQLQPAHPDAQLPIGGEARPASRRISSDRPRTSAANSGRSRHSHHSSRSQYDDTDRGRRSRKHDTISGDRASLSSRRSRHSHYSLRHHFDDDVGRDVEPEPEPLKRRKTRYPTLSGSLFSMWNAMKKSLEK